MRFPNPNPALHDRSPHLPYESWNPTSVPLSGPRPSPGDTLVGFPSSGTPGRSIRRSRGVTPSLVAPECLGGLEESRRDSNSSLLICAVQPRVAGSLVAMTKPVSRDSKLKGPKESTGRALVNYASGKYLSSPIKPMSLDMSLEHWCLEKVMPLQVLQ